MMPFSPKPKQILPPPDRTMEKAHKIHLGGLELVPDLSGALMVPEFEALIISDLHLEQGASLARRGIRVPPFDTEISLLQLEAVVAAYQPKQLIFLGDTFHDVYGETHIDAKALARLVALSETYACYWISGNHDPLPPQFLKGTAVDELHLGPLTLRHEPSRLDKNEFEISGHLHPGCAIVQRGRRISAKCFVSDEKRLIMPAFGAYTGALPITNRAFAWLFDRAKTTAHMLGEKQIFAFPHARLA